MIDRVEIKAKAKKLAKENLWNFWKPMLFITIAELLVFLFTDLLFKDNIIADIISIVVTVALIPASSFAIDMYVLKMSRGQGADINIFKEAYQMFSRLVWISALVGLLVFAWGLLLIVPGIIMALAYSMFAFISMEDKSLEGMAPLRKSQEMMNGHKKDYFIFGLSFLGWTVLCVLIIPLIFVMPYIYFANALYYDKLKEITSSTK